ncbi:hypothetical protein F53441_6069 [Fusarium austroafricanum]|uniref:Uncharacterized protein n=1 Tax=Fusarium austroafricanum TaxID=2364996 RepID=A0A8H4KIL4_9HYPO|nr:hypothetical protein F53441_6069 [Fusarium austroafricanum]
MKHIFILLSALWSTKVAAQRYTYTTRTMTECFSTTQTSFGPAEPTQGEDKYWTVEMPECQDCLCTDCAYTNTYTTTLDVLSPTGIAKFPYQVKEIYRGMSAMPADATSTAVPYGFTSGVETCSICGDEPVTGTMTYPRGGSPYQESVPTATLAAQTVVQRPSTLRTQIADTEATGTPSDENGTRPLENTVLEHKVVKYHGKAPDAADFARLLGSNSALDVGDAKSKTRRKPSRGIRSYAKMRFESAEAAPSKDADGAAARRHPPSGVAIALLVPIALLI